MTELIGKILIGVGLTFDFLGCLGLLRMPDLYNRLQASTKCVTFGTCSILFGLFIWSGFSPMGVKALLCMVFIALTSPVAAHALARGAHRAGVKLCDTHVVDRYAEDQQGAGSGKKEETQ